MGDAPYLINSDSKKALSPQGFCYILPKCFLLSLSITSM